jgi:cytochrome c biogenesis protein CcmG/thiol:disulfide interchange protein DsbE
MGKLLKTLIPLAIFLLMAGFLFVGLSKDPREIPSPLIGKAAPEFSAKTLADEAKTIKRADMLGKVWVLNVWASWCEACRQEHPLLVEWTRGGQAGATVIGLDYKDDRTAGKEWLSSMGNPYADSVFDADGRIGIDFGVYGVPETFLIDKEGVIRYKHVGPLTPDAISKELAPMIARLNK